MKRYEMFVCECFLGAHVDCREDEDGGWVRADEAISELKDSVALTLYNHVERDAERFQEALRAISDKNTGGLEPDVYAYMILNPE